MKIAIVICLFGREELSSGAVRIAHNLALNLCKTHRVHIFSGVRFVDLRSSLDRVKYDDGIDWWRFSINGFLDPFKEENYNNPLCERFFKEFLHNIKPDIIHFHAIQGLGANLVRLSKEYGIPSIVHVHDWWWFCPCLFLTRPDGILCNMDDVPSSCNCVENAFLKRRYSYLMETFSMIDLRLFVSKYIYDYYLNHGHIGPMKGHCRNAHILENPISPIALSSPCHPVSIPFFRRRGIRFSYFGGDNIHKGITVLKEACSRLKGDFQMFYYGLRDTMPALWDGFKEAVMMRLKDGQREFFRPKFSHSELPRILRDTDVVIVPSVMLESFNLVAREALTAGIPVIASRSGGPETVVRDGCNGWLFPRGDAGALVSIMQRLIDNPSMVVKAREYIEKNPISYMSWGDYTKKILTIYEDMAYGQ